MPLPLLSSGWSVSYTHLDVYKRQVYDYAVPKQIPLDTFEKFVRSSKEGTLPEFYVLSENGTYIGYILLDVYKRQIQARHPGGTA